MFIYVMKERKGKRVGLRASEGDQLITRENTETSIHNMLACSINSFPALDSSANPNLVPQCGKQNTTGHILNLTMVVIEPSNHTPGSLDGLLISKAAIPLLL